MIDDADIETNASRRRSRNSRGFVLIWVVLWMTLLLGFAGLSVDLGNWYLHIQLAQRAVDAAALDGAPLLPEQFSPNAQQVAYNSLIANGITPSSAYQAKVSLDCGDGKPCVRPVPGQPAQLQVQVSVTVPNIFLRFLGVSKSITFSRTSIATYRSSVALGNVDNVLGAEPPPPCGCKEWPFRWQDPAKATGNADYWLGIDGSGENKVEGDRYASRTCTGGSDPTLADGCSGGINTEYDPNGYDYHVQVDPGGTARYVRIDVYDPAFIYTSWNCPTTGGPGITCAGDTIPDWPVTQGPPSTTFTVTANNDSTTPLNCNGGMNGTPFPGYEDPLNANPPTSGPWTAWLHQWVTICDAVAIDPAQATQLTIHVKSGPGDGENDFAIRAAALDGPSLSNIDQQWTYNHVRVSAGNRMVVFNNYDATSPTSFHLVRVLPSWAGQTVQWQLYDIGDGNGSGWLNIVGSPDVNAAQTFNASTCEWTPPGSAQFQPTGTGAGGGCKIDVNPDTFNGRVLNFKWHVPTSYSCDYNSSSGCWVMIDMNIPNGGVDTTTWTLGSEGSPVKIINRGG